MTNRPLPLAGITVVSIEQAIAAPLASRHLADWGAEVIKVERPGSGDFCRDYDYVMDGMSSQFVWTNRSKKSVELDIKEPADRAVLDSLIAGADVFVQNLAPGAASRIGLGAEALVKKHPRLIACDVSGYGSNGPLSSKKAYDLLVQCEVGLPSINGDEERLAKCGVSIVDIATGMYVLQGVLMGLYTRERTGHGYAFEVSLFDSISEWMSYPANYAFGAGKPLQRTGLKHATIAPYGPFRTGDGHSVFLAVQNQREWSAFCRVVLGERALENDRRFATNPDRTENRDALTREIEERFAKMSRADVVVLLDHAAIANARLNDTVQFLQHEQLRSRQRVRDIETPVGSAIGFLPAVTIKGIDPVMGAVPKLGEHSLELRNRAAQGDRT